MKIKLVTALLAIAFTSCEQKDNSYENKASPISGTWKLVSARTITKTDTIVTFPVKNQEMIKIFNNDTFAFFKHNTDGLTGDSAVFDAGSGSYKLEGDRYSEHLEYCNYRGWENRDFSFNLRISNDSLIQTGIEKIDSLHVDQQITEIYVRRK